MNKPTKEQKNDILLIVTESIGKLIENDSDIFNKDPVEYQELPKVDKILNRELHEVTINHRLAYYIERRIEETSLAKYKVDIEYNRYYNSPKEVVTLDGVINARPDIVIHARMDNKMKPQHYLVIETKKNKITKRDISKVKAFISDPRYEYLFGLTISYKSNADFILCKLYYSNDGKKITFKKFNVDRKTGKSDYSPSNTYKSPNFK